MNFTYSKEFRLRTKQDFNGLRFGSNKISSGCLVVYWKNKNQNQFCGKLGISVRKKFGPAVFRNKVKRTLREAFRLSDLKNKTADFLVVYSPQKKLTKDDLAVELKRNFDIIAKNLISR